MSAARETTLAIRIVLLVVALGLMTLPALAQSTAGRVLGSVTDQSGASVAGATVVIADTERGTSRTLTTDSSGEYVAPDLIPGTYKIHVAAKGFKSTERPNITIEVATDVRADFTLQPGNVSEVVIVSGEIPLLNTTSSTLGGTLSNQEINDLPLNGRNYQNLLQLRPGVMRYPGGGFSTTSANGLRAEDNAFLIDGLYNSEPFSGQGILNGAGIVGDSATILPIDSIQEFNLQQNPPAEYGWKPGAIVNVGLKSGTNRLHGTAFAFGRDGALDARNYFNTGPAAKVDRSLEQFGGSLGGAIIKNKAFFFGAYEGQRYNIGNTYSVTTPSMQPLPTPAVPNCTYVVGDCLNSVPNAIADLQAAMAAGVLDAHGQSIVPSKASELISGCTWAATGPVTCVGTGFPINNNLSPNFVQGFPNQAGTDDVVAKVDYNLNSRHTISGTYFFGNNSGTAEDFAELESQWRSKIHTRAQVVGGNWIWTPNTNWVNEARAGYSRLYQPTFPGDINTPPSAYGLTTGVSGLFTGGLPRIGFAGAFVPGEGGFKWPKFQGPDTVTQFIDHVSYTFGKHSFKFGGELRRDAVNGGAFGNARGSITVLGGVAITAGAGSTALEDFFAGDPFKASVQVGDPKRQLHDWAYGLFVQDDWRVTKNLTLNYGLRYEFSTVPKEAHNRLGNFDSSSATGVIQVGINGVSRPFDSAPKDFAPRVGFAWDVMGTGNTVLRGGVGLMYESVNWESFLAFNNSYGLTNIPTGAIIANTGLPNQQTAGGTITSGNLLIPPILPQWDSSSPLYGNLSTSSINCDPLAGGPCPIMSVVRNLTTPYVWNYNLNVQHAFTPKLSLEIGYVGNHGTNLTGIRDINQETPGSNDQTTRPYNAQFGWLSNIFQMGNIYKSNYNGLQATLTARNYHGLSMVVGYTFSHSLDDVGANWDFGAGYGMPQDSTHPQREYASSDFDIRHRFTASITYAVPGKKGHGQIFEGWEINAIATLQSAQPWGVIDLTSGLDGIGSAPFSPPQFAPMRWDFFGNPSDFKSGSTPIPFFPAGSPSTPAACTNDAASVGASGSLATFGCFAKGNSVLIAPPAGQFGTMGRNLFRDSGFSNLDFSIAKNWHFGERLQAQFRAEFFNILNHPNFANPYGGQNGYGNNDPVAAATLFGCGCVTPDIAAANPAVGSGGPRSVQLGLKFTF
ncbi:MAG TPA: TonB-dependent receptor [Candidatus Dormibacteraeota bacterium]|nr:TonB-dependent receptor [Candidatus Dormibacteraeota bacterium]